MGCGCGGSGGGVGGSSIPGAGGSAPPALLSGVLDGQYADLPGGVAASSARPSVAAADVTGADSSTSVSNAFSSGGFWVVLLFVLGGAWYLDRIKRENE